MGSEHSRDAKFLKDYHCPCGENITFRGFGRRGGCGTFKSLRILMLRGERTRESFRNFGSRGLPKPVSLDDSRAVLRTYRQIRESSTENDFTTHRKAKILEDSHIPPRTEQWKSQRISLFGRSAKNFEVSHCPSARAMRILQEFGVPETPEHQKPRELQCPERTDH